MQSGEITTVGCFNRECRSFQQTLRETGRERKRHRLQNCNVSFINNFIKAHKYKTFVNFNDKGLMQSRKNLERKEKTKRKVQRKRK